jgi:hypothetical protein
VEVDAGVHFDSELYLLRSSNTTEVEIVGQEAGKTVDRETGSCGWIASWGGFIQHEE